MSAEERVRRLTEWALSRIRHCDECEDKFRSAHRYQIPHEPVERRQEKRTLQAVLAMLHEGDEET